jgi:hypothetical protein
MGIEYYLSHPMHNNFMIAIVICAKGSEDYDISYRQVVKVNVMICYHEIIGVESRLHAIAVNDVEWIQYVKEKPDSQNSTRYTHSYDYYKY